MHIYLPIAEMPVNVLVFLGMGLAVGFISGLFGVGGGFLMTPLLIFSGVPAAVAVGTGAAQIVATSVSGSIAQYQRNNVDVKMGIVLICGGLVGSVIGVQSASGYSEGMPVPTSWLRGVWGDIPPDAGVPGGRPPG